MDGINSITQGRIVELSFITFPRIICLFVWSSLNVAFNNLSFSHIATVSGNITSKTLWHAIPHSHIILTLSWPVLALLSKQNLNAQRQVKEQLVPFFKGFGMTRPGIEPATSWSQSGYATTETLCQCGDTVAVWRYRVGVSTDKYVVKILLFNQDLFAHFFFLFLRENICCGYSSEAPFQRKYVLGTH